MRTSGGIALRCHFTTEKRSPYFDFGSLSWPRQQCRWFGVAGSEQVPQMLLGWYYSRNQFEQLPEQLLSIENINFDSEIPLRTANKQTQCQDHVILLEYTK